MDSVFSLKQVSQNINTYRRTRFAISTRTARATSQTLKHKWQLIWHFYTSNLSDNVQLWKTNGILNNISGFKARLMSPTLQIMSYNLICQP